MDHTKIFTLKQLSNYLRCPEEFLSEVVSNEYNVYDCQVGEVSNSRPSQVLRFRIPKKGNKGGFRTVHKVIIPQLESILKILNTYLSQLYQPRDCVHGFVAGRNIKTNASQHLGMKSVLSVDIENFFESTSIEMITNSLVHLGFNIKAAKWIATLTTIDGVLVQGFSTSPTLANIIFDKVDNCLLRLCKGNFVYTRYADDLYFSSNSAIPSFEDVEKIIEDFNYKLNHNKTILMKRGQKQYVTGLTVYDKKMPRISKRIKRRLRLEVHKIHQHGFHNHVVHRLKSRGEYWKCDNLNAAVYQEKIEVYHRIYGWIHFINSIEPKVSSKLLVKFKRATS